MDRHCEKPKATKQSWLLRLLVNSMAFILLVTTMLLPAQAFNLSKFLRFDKMKQEFDNPYQSEPLKRGYERLTIAFVSDANLYPAPINSVTSFSLKPEIQKPPVNSIVLYEESQVLLQEAIRELIQLAGTTGLDMVIFGGSQVYTNDYYPLFQDIAADLNKFSIPHYSLLGENELQGANHISHFFKDRYYLLKTKNTNIIVLDNVTEPVVPEFLPEEATEQYIWFKKTLEKISNTDEELYIFSYKPLEQRTKNLINKYSSLKLKLVAYSSMYEFSSYEATEDDGLSAKPLFLSNSSISAFPLAYAIIERDSNGQLKIRNKEIALEGIRKLAKQRWN